MDKIEITLTNGQSPNNTVPLTDLEIISYRSITNLIIFKVKQDEKIIYISYYPRSTFEKFIFLDILNDLPLWSYEWNHNFGNVYAYNTTNYPFTIKLNIHIDNLLFNEYLNKSIAINCLISNIYENLPLFEKTDFSSKSFISYENPIEPPNNFKVTLYEYQKKSLGKMIKIEKGETNFKVKYTVPLTVYNNEIMYDPITNKKTDEDKYLDINIRGGVLSDEMGLGKTITSIALIASNPPAKDHSAVKYSNEYQMNKLFTKATLVLCPSHLTKQWETEVKKCSPGMKILTIVTKKDMDKLNVTGIINADIIITSHQFLMNFKYYPALHYKVSTASSYNSTDRKVVLKNVLAGLLKDEAKLLSLETPVFEFFFFQRIIIDEGHEIFGEMLGSGALSRYMSDWVSSMDANYYWYVSGTPFVNFMGIMNCSKYINLKLVEPNRQLSFDYSSKKHTNDYSSELFNFLKKEYVWNNILGKICIRHRKKDVEEEIQIPGYDEKLIWIKFTNLEKQLYDAKKGKVPNYYLQQLCCHPMVIESSKKIFGDIEVDLSVMQDKLLDYHKKNYDLYKEKLSKLDPKKHEYHMLKKTFETTMNESHYMVTILTQMIEKPIDENEKCSICLDSIDNPTLTACGHLFCYDCLKMCLGDKKKCPMCKADLSGKEILVMNKKEVSEEKVNPLIQKYGSKLGKAISIIRTLVALPSSRIIIFSQWDDMLILIGKTLSENGIENCFVNGNVWSRNKAISKFKAGKNTEGEDNKVIMLSLKNAASGTNLTEATHILFIEPINSPSEECRAIEGQAIGRACRVGQKNKVNVMRILIQDSIEEEIYRKSYNKDIVVDIKNEDKIINELIPQQNSKDIVV
jgi:SWI/SNF-related matrix-associated actin-dependent regulator of chromatin subfamily A3